MLTNFDLTAAAYVCDEPMDTSTPYIHTPNDVSLPFSQAILLSGVAGREN